MCFLLPDEITEGAALRGNEYGWEAGTFPKALKKASALGYACLGGQFQFRLDCGTYEMYWIDADSDERFRDESWSKFCERSCSQVLQKFEQRIESTDFAKEVTDWPSLREASKGSTRLEEMLVFVAYFVTESDWLTDHGR